MSILNSKKTTVLIVIVLLVIMGGAATAYFAWFRVPYTPNPEQQTPAEITQFMASDEFSHLSDDQKVQYWQQAREAHPDEGRRLFRNEELTDEQRQKLRENMGAMRRHEMEERMNKQLDEYFALSPEERPAYLDKLIDERQQRRDQWRQRAATRPTQPPQDPNRPRNTDRRGRGGGGRHGPPEWNPDRVRNHIEHQDPVRHAQRVQFIRDMMERRKARGLPAWGPPR